MLFPKGSVGSSPTFGTYEKWPRKLGAIFCILFLATVAWRCLVDGVADAVDT